MSNNPRAEIKRKLDGLINHVETIQNALAFLGELYREHHPEITKQYEVTYAFAQQLKELLDGLKMN